jgi:hypothetical protein
VKRAYYDQRKQAQLCGAIMSRLKATDDFSARVKNGGQIGGDL